MLLKRVPLIDYLRETSVEKAFQTVILEGIKRIPRLR